MTAYAVTRLSRVIQTYFEHHLPTERRLSSNTVLSYRDAMVLFLRYVAETKGRDVDSIELEDLDASLVRGFGASLARDRRAKPSTCNQRLAAMKAFFKYLATVAPEHMDRCRLIREVPRRRVDHREPRYLLRAEVETLLAATARTRSPTRDQALLITLYNTGARVQELADLDIDDVVFDAPPRVLLRGKGRKERTCLLWASTVKALREWLAEHPDACGDKPLFVSSRGERLSRSGIAFVMRSLARRAALARDGRELRISPHVMRHTTAMHMLQAGVDVIAISAWLGHANVSTTHGYVEVDLRMKQAAIAATAPPRGDRRARHPGPKLVERLKAIGQGRGYVQRRRWSGACDQPLVESLHITENST